MHDDKHGRVYEDDTNDRIIAAVNRLVGKKQFKGVRVAIDHYRDDKPGNNHHYIITAPGEAGRLFILQLFDKLHETVERIHHLSKKINGGVDHLGLLPGEMSDHEIDQLEAMQKEAAEQRGERPPKAIHRYSKEEKAEWAQARKWTKEWLPDGLSPTFIHHDRTDIDHRIHLRTDIYSKDTFSNVLEAWSKSLSQRKRRPRFEVLPPPENQPGIQTLANQTAAQRIVPLEITPSRGIGPGDSSRSDITR